jgi:hypothetical protein
MKKDHGVITAALSADIMNQTGDSKYPFSI